MHFLKSFAASLAVRMTKEILLLFIHILPTAQSPYEGCEKPKSMKQAGDDAGRRLERIIKTGAKRQEEEED